MNLLCVIIKNDLLAHNDSDLTKIIVICSDRQKWGKVITTKWEKYRNVIALFFEILVKKKKKKRR